MRTILAVLLAAGLAAPASAQITSAEYAQRRSTLASQLPDGIFIARGAVSPVQDYLAFYQSPGFLYLTGYRESDAALLLEKAGARQTWTLFVQTKIPSQEVWSGRRYGPDSAGRATGIETRPITDFETTVDSLLSRTPRLSFLADVAEEATPSTATTASSTPCARGTKDSRSPTRDAPSPPCGRRRARPSST